MGAGLRSRPAGPRPLTGSPEGHYRGSAGAYSAMIFCLVAASVPTDMTGLLWFSLRGAPGPVHPGTLDPRPIARRFWCLESLVGQPGKAISGARGGPIVTVGATMRPWA